MTLAFALVAVIVYVGVGGFAFTLCKSAAKGDQMMGERKSWR